MDIPPNMWRDYQKANRPRLVICKKNQLEVQAEWRNARNTDGIMTH